MMMTTTKEFLRVAFASFYRKLTLSPSMVALLFRGCLSGRTTVSSHWEDDVEIFTLAYNTPVSLLRWLFHQLFKFQLF